VVPHACGESFLTQPFGLPKSSEVPSQYSLKVTLHPNKNAVLSLLTRLHTYEYRDASDSIFLAVGGLRAL
jgi:hypothetical protein